MAFRASPRPRQTPVRAVALAVALAGLVGPGCRAPDSAVKDAVLLSQKGQDREAIARLEAHVAAHPRAIAERRLLVRLRAVTGDLGAAEREAEGLARLLPPRSPLPWIELGHALELAHRYEEALSMYDRAADIAPKDPIGPRTGGLRAARWGEAEASATRLEEALRRKSQDAVVWHALGLVRMHLGDLAGARIAYESGLVADPRALENRLGLATLALRRGDPRAALAQYDRLVESKPGFREGHVGRAWALTLLGRYEDANAALDEARRLGADPAVIDRQRRTIEARVRRKAEK